jgi:hypothetical protein
MSTSIRFVHWQLGALTVAALTVTAVSVTAVVTAMHTMRHDESITTLLLKPLRATFVACHRVLQCT